MKTELVNPSDLINGDTVLIKGDMKTLSESSIKGNLINGIKYIEIERVLFPKWFKGKIVRYQPQI